jgi:hypothetical protein
MENGPYLVPGKFMRRPWNRPPPDLSAGGGLGGINIAMFTLQITSVGDLEFKIAERRFRRSYDRRPLYRNRVSDQYPLGNAVISEFLFCRGRPVCSRTCFKKIKGTLIKFVQLIFLQMIH